MNIYRMATYRAPKVILPIFNPLVYPVEESASERSEVISYSLTQVSQLDKWESVACSADGTIIYGVEGSKTVNTIEGYIWVSTNSGQTWTARNIGFEDLKCYSGIACSADGTRAVTAKVFGNDTIYYTPDSGTFWYPVDIDVKWSNFACSDSGLIMYGASNTNYIYKSINGGASWSSLTTAGSLGWSGVACSSNGDIVYGCVGVAIGNNSGYVYKSTDGGANWTALTTSLIQRYTSVSCSSNGQIVIAGARSSGLVIVSTDGGDSWTTTSLPSGFYSCVKCSPDGTRLFATRETTLGRGFYYSGDFGVNWIEGLNTGEVWKGVTCNTDGSVVYTCNKPDGTSGEGYIWRGTESIVIT